MVLTIAADALQILSSPYLRRVPSPLLMTFSILPSQPYWYTCSGGTGNSCLPSLLNSCPESI
jgi:hypothetical protein